MTSFISTFGTGEILEVAAVHKLELTTDAVRDIGKKLRDIREAENLTLEEVGRRLGVSAQAVGEVERNETGITLERLSRLLKVLGTSGEIALFRDKGEKDSLLPSLKRFELAFDISERLTELAPEIIESIYLYGSTVRVAARAASDLDLVVVVRADRLSKQRWWIQFYRELQDILLSTDIYVSLQVYTVSEWADDNSNFKSEVSERGLRLYQREAGSTESLATGT